MQPIPSEPYLPEHADGDGPHEIVFVGGPFDGQKLFQWSRPRSELLCEARPGRLTIYQCREVAESFFEASFDRYHDSALQRTSGVPDFSLTKLTLVLCSGLAFTFVVAIAVLFYFDAF